MTTYVLVIWLWGSPTNAPPIVVPERFTTLVACEVAGHAWELIQNFESSTPRYVHHACLPHQ